MRVAKGKIMRRMLILLVALAASTPLSAQVHVKGYVRSDGTYVAPYVRSSPDRTILNNYSTVPNVNPYTGQPGTVNPYAPRTSNPYAPSTLYSAPKPPPVPCYSNCPG